MSDATLSNPVGSSTLLGRRILLVEDHYLTAYHLTLTLQQLGCHVLGPAATFNFAVELLEHEKFDGVILDIDIIGGSGITLARQLLARGCPFVFLSGKCCQHPLPPDLEHLPCYSKPITSEGIQQLILRHFT